MTKKQKRYALIALLVALVWIVPGVAADGVWGFSNTPAPADPAPAPQATLEVLRSPLDSPLAIPMYCYSYCHGRPDL